MKILFHSQANCRALRVRVRNALRVCAGPASHCLCGRWKREWSGYDVSPSGESGTFPKASSDVLLHERTHSRVHFRKLGMWIESQPTQLQRKCWQQHCATYESGWSLWFPLSFCHSVFLSFRWLSVMVGLHRYAMTQDACFCAYCANV